MRRTLSNNTVLLGLIALLGLFPQSSAEAQFLDKLEAAVRAQFEKAQQAAETSNESAPQPANLKTTNGNPSAGNSGTPAQSTEELPAPTTQPTRRTVPANPRPIAPGDETPSILELTPSAPFVVPNPVNENGRNATSDPALPSVAAPLDAGEPLNRIYLGLEAEDPVGGGIGVRVTMVTKDSPAWKSGFEVGDQILAVNGFAIANLDSMVEQLSNTAPGQSVRFLTKRGGRNLNLVAVLQNAGTAADINRNSITNTGPGWLGVVVTDLSGAFRQQFGISIFSGAAVTSVAPDSPAALAGIKAGHAIAEIDGIKVEGAVQMMAIVDGLRPGDVLSVKVAQGVFVRPMTITLAAPPSDSPPKRSSSRVNAVTNGTTRAAPIRNAPQNQLGDDQAVQQQAVNQPAAAEAAAEREEQLLQEIDRLQAELDAANSRIADTEQRLNGILESLNRKR